MLPGLGSVHLLTATPESADLITNHTSSSSASGTAAASTESGAGFEAWRGFDGLTTANDHWAANTATGWLRYQFAATRVVTEYRVTGPITGYGTNRAPRDWTFEGSDDASSWTTLDTQSSVTGWSSLQQRNYPISNTTSYIYYRLNVTANDGGALLMVAELRLIGY